jgi:signal peptidase I
MIDRILIELAIAFAIRTFVVEPFDTASTSMLPVLARHDVVLVQKAAYGIGRASFPFASLEMPLRSRGFVPDRGAIIVFENRKDERRLRYIKRIIGLPGETVQFVQGRLFINGQKVERHAIEPFTSVFSDGQTKTVPRYIEDLPGGRSHEIIEMNGDEAGLADNTATTTIPDGHVFVAGDNRDSSQDSRFKAVGFVPIEDIIGPATRIAYSIDLTDDEHKRFDRLPFGSFERFVYALKMHKFRRDKFLQPLR